MIEKQPSSIQTSVEEVDVDIDSWLGAPGADSIVTPIGGKEEAKPHFFSPNKADLSFLDDGNMSKEGEAKDVSRETQIALKDLDTELISDEELEEQSKKPGRPRTEKSGLVEFLKKRIESKEMFAFDDYDESKQSLDDYLISLGEKDIEDLWKANVDNLKQEVATNTPAEFFDSLPEELQYAAKYVMDGGQDLKGLFSALAQVEQVRDLDPTETNDQEYIVRSYLQATNFGSADEIEEELTTWRDIGALEKKAKQFKPKLDAMQEKIVQYHVEQQEGMRQQQEQAANAYMQNVFEALRPAEINGLRLDKKTQAQLYTGLVQPQYPSISGRPTNLLGHLLEKYQFVEPNYPLIAEALWLLSNPDEYRGSLMKQGKTQAVEQTVKQLKTEQSRKTSSTYFEEEQHRSKKISRPQNIFKR
jgi:uncharacterized protein YggL (DUF469 family)